MRITVGIFIGVMLGVGGILIGIGIGLLMVQKMGI